MPLRLIEPATVAAPVARMYVESVTIERLGPRDSGPVLSIAVVHEDVDGRLVSADRLVYTMAQVEALGLPRATVTDVYAGLKAALYAVVEAHYGVRGVVE